MNHPPVHPPPPAAATPRRWLIMGVSGSGKSTLGSAWAARLGQPFFDADDYHPPANLRKMRDGQPLTDDDRWPWLDRLNQLLLAEPAAVLACSALKTDYRQALRRGLDDLAVVYLHVDPTLLRRRMQDRQHFMPPALLDSQLRTLEPPCGDQAIRLDGSQPLPDLLNQLYQQTHGPA